MESHQDMNANYIYEAIHRRLAFAPCYCVDLQMMLTPQLCVQRCLQNTFQMLLIATFWWLLAEHNSSAGFHDVNDK